MQASTLGALEALLEFLRTPAVNIAVSGINIGPVRSPVMHGRDGLALACKAWPMVLLPFQVERHSRHSSRA